MRLKERGIHPDRTSGQGILLYCCLIWVLLAGGLSSACLLDGDLDGDCRVGLNDLALMAAQWMGPAACGSEAGLTLHWTLNETGGSSVPDASELGRNGSVVGARWNPSGGLLAGALEFDGTDDYVWTTYKGILGADPRTCTAWIKTARAPGEILSWGDRDIDAARWVVWLDETGVLRVDTGGGCKFGTTVLTDDLWHHVAVVSDGTATDQIILYVDGKIEPVGGVISQSINTQARATAKVGVFQLAYLAGFYFDGLIDDVRLYDRGLSLRQVWSLVHTATINPTCADLNLDDTVNLTDAVRLSQNWDRENPVILMNEFLADNESKSPLGPGELLDGNFESSDWIELYNPSSMSVDVGGWYLTDDAAVKTKWRFPMPTVLQPGGYLIVFASGKTPSENPGNYPYVDPAGYLHTNFQLSKEGEYLGLIAADGITPIHDYAHIALGGGVSGYPAQEADISYGYYYGEPRYFSVPTPGADNIRSPFEDIVEKPDVSVKGGCYLDGVQVALSCGTPDAFIRYTTDGSVPSLTNGLDYTGPVSINSLTTLLAAAFKPGLQSSDVRIETYVFVEPDLTPFDTNLPIVVVDTLGVTIPSDKVLKPSIDCRVVIIEPDALTGRAVITGPKHFEGWGRIRRRGESTYGQGHYALEIQDAYRRDNDVALLGMPAESDWVLSYDVIDYSMMKNEIAFKWFRDMGHYAPRQRYVELYFNDGGGKIASGDYKGLFMLRENIKRGEHRVDIARLDASHNLEPKVSGGYIVKSDKYNDGDTLLADGPGGVIEPDYLESTPYGIQVNGGGKPILDEPAPLKVTPSQIHWIADYINEFHSVLWQNTAGNYYPGPQARYTDYIDPASWIDHGILEQMCCDSDAFWGSYFTHKDRDGKIFSGPPWDYDRSFHNNGGSYDQAYYGWRTNGGIFGKWHQKFETQLEYKLMLADRWFEHRKRVLNTDLTLAYIDQTAARISEARSRPRKSYPKPFDEEVQLFKGWISNRLNWMDGHIAGQFAQRPPIFSRPGGYAGVGEPLAMTRPDGVSGTIYFTLDGSDPRLESGAVNPNAQVFSDSQMTVQSLVAMSSSVWTYLYDGSDQGTAWRTFDFDDSGWGAGPGQLGFGDNPADENTNIGPKVNGRRTAYFRHFFTVEDVSEVTGLTITLLHDDGAVVYLNEQDVGRAYMPDGPVYFDTLSAVQGENTTTIITDIPAARLREGVNLLAVEVHQRTDDSSDISFDLDLTVTRMQSLLAKSACVKARIKDGSQWSALNKEVYAVGPVRESLRITELMYHPADPTEAELTAAGDPNLTDEDFEFIELQNVGDAAINLNLVRFTDGIDFTFGDYTLAAGDYAVLVKNPAAFAARYQTTGINIIPGSYPGSLDNAGEEIVLRDAIGAEIHDFDYRDSWYELTDGAGFSLTVIDPAGSDPNTWDSKAGWRSSLYKGGTPGFADSVLAAGSIVINEVLAHSHQAEPDWIELYNTTGQDIHIGGWFLSDSNINDPNIRKYQIPDGTVIGAYGYSVFVENQTFGNPLAPGCAIPFGLSEAGETVYLYSGQNGQVTGYYQTEENFDATETGVTIGRYEKPELSGGYDFTRLAWPTRGSVNSSPRIAAVVISEIHYNPPQGGTYEFVELYNRSGTAVTLMSEATTETAPGVFVTESIPWRLEGIGFTFPTNTTIPAGGRLIAVKEPGLPIYNGVNKVGPYSGALDNGGEQIDLQIPGDQEYGKERYWIPIDKVDYDDVAPWPGSADGDGDSLHRIDLHAYGRDYSNWQGAAPTPGL